MADLSKEDLSSLIDTIRHLTTVRMLSTPVGKLQSETKADRKAKGPSWVSRVKFQAPAEDDALQLVADAIKRLGTGNEDYALPLLDDVHAHWNGFRAGVADDEPEPELSEREKFCRLDEEVKTPTTLLYAHGGGNYLLGPAARRATCTKLAELTGGKCLVLQHRLAPQNPFPSAVLDLLLAYLSLLYPPEHSFHSPTLAQHIIFAGDSSGSELALSVIQIILNAQKQQGSAKPTLQFHGRQVELPMPAGLAFQSPSADNQHETLPSWAANVSFDVVPADPPGYEVGFPTDDVWPSDPPRGNYYCETSMLYHPLVCPMAVKRWHGCPPIYIAMGSKERLVDGGKLIAQFAARQGIAVQWDEYEMMPHNWPMVIPDHPHSKQCYSSWSEACSRFAGGERGTTKGTFTELDSMRIRNRDVTKLTTLTMGDVERLMKDKQKVIKPFTGRPAQKSLL